MTEEKKPKRKGGPGPGQKPYTETSGFLRLASRFRAAAATTSLVWEGFAAASAASSAPAAPPAAPAAAAAAAAHAPPADANAAAAAVTSFLSNVAAAHAKDYKLPPPGAAARVAHTAVAAMHRKADVFISKIDSRLARVTAAILAAPMPPLAAGAAAAGAPAGAAAAPASSAAGGDATGDAAPLTPDDAAAAWFTELRVALDDALTFLAHAKTAAGAIAAPPSAAAVGHATASLTSAFFDGATFGMALRRADSCVMRTPGGAAAAAAAVAAAASSAAAPSQGSVSTATVFAAVVGAMRSGAAAPEAAAEMEFGCESHAPRALCCSSSHESSPDAARIRREEMAAGSHPGAALGAGPNGAAE